MDAVIVTLKVDPLEGDLGPGASLAITGTARNCGSAAVDLRLHESDLYVDGEPSLEWKLAIANGARYPEEDSLPPGAQLDFRRNLGASILRGPGEHILKLRVLNRESPSVIVSRRTAGGDDDGGHGDDRPG